MRYYSIVSIRFAANVSKNIARKNVIIVAVRYVVGISHVMRNSLKFQWLWYSMRMMKIPLKIPMWYSRHENMNKFEQAHTLFIHIFLFVSFVFFFVLNRFMFTISIIFCIGAHCPRCFCDPLLFPLTPVCVCAGCFCVCVCIRRIARKPLS